MSGTGPITGGCREVARLSLVYTDTDSTTINYSHFDASVPTKSERAVARTDGQEATGSSASGRASQPFRRSPCSVSTIGLQLAVRPPQHFVARHRPPLRRVPARHVCHRQHHPPRVRRRRRPPHRVRRRRRSSLNSQMQRISSAVNTCSAGSSGASRAQRSSANTRHARYRVQRQALRQTLRALQLPVLDPRPALKHPEQLLDAPSAPRTSAPPARRRPPSAPRRSTAAASAAPRSPPAGSAPSTCTAHASSGRLPGRSLGGWTSTRATRSSVSRHPLRPRIRPPARDDAHRMARPHRRQRPRISVGSKRAFPGGPPACPACAACRSSSSYMSLSRSPTTITRVAGQARPSSRPCAKPRSQRRLSFLRLVRRLLLRAPPRSPARSPPAGAARA